MLLELYVRSEDSSQNDYKIFTRDLTASAGCTPMQNTPRGHFLLISSSETQVSAGRTLRQCDMAKKQQWTSHPHIIESPLAYFNTYS